jgi:hypothetical protein
MHEVIGMPINFLIRFLISPFTRLDHQLQDWWRGRGKAEWPQASAEVQTSQMKEKAGRIWQVIVYYSYQAEGKWWPGSTWRQFALKKDAQRYIDSHPAGSAFIVRYLPTEAGKSVVLARDQQVVPAQVTI